MSERAYVETLNAEYFNGQLSPPVIDRLACLPVERDDVRAFVERMFRTMRRAGFRAHDVSTLQADILGSLLSRLLPGRWEGRVPPITVAGRHRRIDELVRRVMEDEGRPPGTFLDVACGFPPLTTVDTATALPGWRVTGLDRALPAYLVHDAYGNYAVFDRERRATYFQPTQPTPEAWSELLRDWQGSRERFEKLLARLLERRATEDPDAWHVEDDGAKLEVSPARSFERENLRFMESDIAHPHAERADVVRCFNMLLYFDDAFRNEALRSFGALVNEDGMLVCGTDWAFTTECRYFVYRKRDGLLQPPEFAFSLDNVAPLGIIQWYTLHDDDREVRLVTELVGALRRDAPFLADLLSFTDGVRAEYGLWPRAADGYYGEASASLLPADIWTHASTMADRLCEHDLSARAVDVLARAGWEARINEVGHIAVAVRETA